MVDTASGTPCSRIASSRSAVRPERPWNTRSYSRSWRHRAALAAGCSAVTKPAHVTPLTVTA